jgi:hypothetical protein
VGFEKVSLSNVNVKTATTIPLSTLPLIANFSFHERNALKCSSRWVIHYRENVILYFVWIENGDWKY